MKGETPAPSAQAREGPFYARIIVTRSGAGTAGSSAVIAVIRDITNEKRLYQDSRTRKP